MAYDTTLHGEQLLELQFQALVHDVPTPNDIAPMKSKNTPDSSATTHTVNFERPPPPA